jgi:hypothetical protein
MTIPVSHDEWQSLIPEHVSGVLSESERTALVGHLSECAECRSLVSDARDFQSGLKLLARQEESHHPTSTEITDYAGNPATLEPNLRETVARHLVLCTSCAREVTLLTEVSRELSARADSEEHPATTAPIGTPDIRRGRIRPLKGRAPVPSGAVTATGTEASPPHFWLRPQAAYAIAAVFVAMLAYPAYRWLTLPSATDSAIVGNAFCLAPQTRGSLRPTEIHVQPSDAAVQFALNAPFSGDYQARVCLLESKSREILRTTLKSALADDQAILITVPGHLLPNGDYSFKVICVGRTTASDTITVQYPFIVRPIHD